MKAKHNFKIKLLICCLAVLLLCATLAACNKYEPEHYDYLVTFDYNLGDLGNPIKMYLGLLDPDKENGVGSIIGMRPGFNTSTFSEATIAGYYLEGWYEPLLDAEGNLQYDEDNHNMVKLQPEEFDFKNHRIHESITLYANLVKSPRMRFIDADTGDVVSEMDGRKPGETRTRPTGSLAPQKTVNGEPYTFMGEYYATRECNENEKFTFPYEFGEEDVDVYCKFIKGDWALVTNSNELVSALSNGHNIYLMNDIEAKNFSSANYNGEFNGNGYTVSGITLNYTGQNAITRFNQANVGVFRSLMGRAYVHDVTFADVVINVATTNTSGGSQEALSASIGMLAAEAREGARVENVTISGTLTCNAYTMQCVKGNQITLHPFIAGLRDFNFDKIVNCDYSGVKVIYLS